MPPRATIGIAGTGRMGTAIARRLLSRGFDVTVWNRSPDRTQEAVAAGARAVTSAAALPEAADVILTLLTNAEAVRSVYCDAEGLLSGRVAGKLFLEMSTVRPGGQREIAAAAAAAGAAFMDCPVGGSTGPASNGTLLGIAGGSAEDLARAQPVLDAFCRKVLHVGPVGAGATVKLAMNLLTQTFWVSFGEALALCAPLGSQPNDLMNIFAEASGIPRVFAGRRDDIAAGLGDPDALHAHFDIDSVRKDLRTILEEARGLGLKLAVTEQVLRLCDEASARGWGARDCTSLPAYIVGRKGGA